MQVLYKKHTRKWIVWGFPHSHKSFLIRWHSLLLSCQLFQLFWPFHRWVMPNIHTVWTLLYESANFVFISFEKYVFSVTQEIRYLKMLIYSVVMLCPQFCCRFAFLLLLTNAIKAEALLVLRRTTWCHLVASALWSGHSSFYFPHSQSHLSWYYSNAFTFRNSDRAVWLISQPKELNVFLLFPTPILQKKTGSL